MTDTNQASSGVSRRRKVLASILLPLILFAALLAFWPGGALQTPGAAAKVPVATHAPGQTHGSGNTPPPQDPSLPPAGKPAKPGPPSSVGAKGETSLDAAASVDPGGTRNNATLPGARGAIDPADVLNPTALGGCLEAYGLNGQCLTVYPPSLARHVKDMVDSGLDVSSMSHDWTCAEVVVYFPTGIAIREPGVDPQGLDVDGDGTACEPD